MADKAKAYGFWLDVEYMEPIQEMCERAGYPVSRLFNDWARGMALAIKLTRVLKRKEISKLDIFRLVGKTSIGV